ncbi:MAG: hypothetical protein IJX10_06405 [Phascolarctobacterium sp.]|nr:hypothetical protein [Phascolarctobacterium sp.]
MVNKSILAMTLALTTMAVTSFAEQPAANKYRAILQSGNFLVEYGDAYFTKTIAAANDMRMERSSYKVKGGGLVGLAVGIGGKGKKDYPDTLYKAGKYYKFESKKKATMATWNQLKDPCLDPAGGWNYAQYALAVPEEFFALCNYDPFRFESDVMVVPKFVGSSKELIDKKEYDCDKYVMAMRSQTGAVMSETNYLYYYDDGELIFVKKIFKKNGTEYPMNEFIVKKITNEVPPETFAIPKGCKVYAVGIGDMNDLIEQPVLVEEY